MRYSRPRKNNELSKIGACVCFCCCFYLLFSILTADNTIYSSYEWQEDIKLVETKFEDNDKVYVPDNWWGLPISLDNPYFVDPTTSPISYDNQVRKFSEEIQKMSELDFEYSQDKWNVIYQKYGTTIGWNGLMNTVKTIELRRELDRIRKRRFLQIGEELYIRAKSTDVRYFMEIASNWGSWEKLVQNFVSEIGIQDIDTFVTSVEDHMCYFKYTHTMDATFWFDCLRNIGRGIVSISGDKFNPGNSLDICEKLKDPQAQFHCAFGVYDSFHVDAAPKKLKFTPCDVEKYPAACYEQKISLFTQYSQTYFPCRTQTDLHHTLACIWGGAKLAQLTHSNYYTFCNQYLNTTEDVKYQYHATCVDGALSSINTGLFGDFRAADICDNVSLFPLSYNACLSRLKNFEHIHPHDYYYNLNLLQSKTSKTNPAEEVIPQNDNINVRGAR